MSKRVLITGARAPVAVDMALLFHRAGTEVHVADSTPLLFAAGLKCVADSYRLPSARGNLPVYARAVADLVKRHGIDLVVPTCEEVFHLAAARDAGFSIPLFAPPITVLKPLHDKFAFIELVRDLGFDAPETTLLRSEADVAALAGRSQDLVFKPSFSRFAVETRVGVAPQKLKRIKPTLQAPWVAQELLKGQEFCIYAVAINGRLAAFSAYRPLYRMGQAASYYFEPVDLPEAERFAAGIVAATRLDGQISFDMIRTADRGLLPVECNPRATSGLHLLADRPEIAERILSRPEVSNLKAEALSPDKVPPLLSGRATRLAPKGAGVLLRENPKAIVCSSSDDIIRPRPAAGPAACKAVMWLLGLAPAIAQGKVGRWRTDKRRARDIFAVPGSPLNLRAWQTLGSYCLEALKTRRPLRAITTTDIEWDGEPLDARP